MDRLYTRERYLECISWMKASPRGISLTTDIIVGFPGETDEDFEKTISLLDEVEYDSMFSFKYSPRPNTPALAFGRSHPGRGETEAALRGAGTAAADSDSSQ